MDKYCFDIVALFNYHPPDLAVYQLICFVERRTIHPGIIIWVEKISINNELQQFLYFVIDAIEQKDKAEDSHNDERN